MRKDNKSVNFFNPLDRKEFDHGSFGVIYENSDGTLTKVMRFDNTSPYVILKIRELNLENFYHVLEIKTNTIKSTTKEYLQAYRMDKILREDVDLLEDNNYLISNIRILINSFNTLTDNYILVNDLHEDNIIINKDGMHMIDCETYRYYPEYQVEQIKEYNLRKLRELLYDVLSVRLNRKCRLGFLKQVRLKELFDNPDLEEILKILEPYSSVMEYVKKKK